MDKVNYVLGFLGYLIVIPIWALALALIVMGIIGLVKKDFKNFKKLLKIWGYFWLGFLVLLVVKFLTSL